MGMMKIHKRRKKGRTYIRISLTPKNPQTRALLRKFTAEVNRFEKSWRAAVRAFQKRREK